MAKLICAIVLACLGLSVSAFFGGGCRGGLGFGNIFNNLTAAQQQQLRQIFQNGKNETKGTIRSRIDAFALTLSPALQAEINRTRNQFDEFQANITRQAQSLSPEAQRLVANINGVIDNQAITVFQERQQIRDLVQNTNQSVFQELSQAGIFLPFFGRRGGRFFDSNSFGSFGASDGIFNRDTRRDGGRRGQFGNGQFGQRGNGQGFGGRGQFGNGQGFGNGQFGNGQFGQGFGNQPGNGQFGQFGQG